MLWDKVAVCRTCGHENPGDAVVCAGCGERLSGGEDVPHGSSAEGGQTGSRDSPTDAGSLIIRGWRLVWGGQYEEAVELFSRALRADPTLEHAYRNRAIAYRHLGRTDLAEADIAAAQRLREAEIAAAQRVRSQALERLPWHQTWWAAAIWLWIPLIFWYGIYVFIAKLTWKQRGATAGTFVGVLATIFIVSFAVALSRGQDELPLASTDYEREAARLFAASRDLTYAYESELDEVYGNPDLVGPALVQAVRPVFAEYRDGLVDIQTRWNRLDPPEDARRFHREASEFWQFEIDFADAVMQAQSEEELTDIYLEWSDEEERRASQVDSMWQELLSD